MSWLWRGVRRRPRRATRRERGLVLEHLEGRWLPSWGGGPSVGLANVTYHGGPLLQHVQVESVYYGTPWSTDPGLQQQISQVDGFLQYFTSSPYMNVLQQYNVFPGTFVGHDIVAQDPIGGQTIDDSQILRGTRFRNCHQSRSYADRRPTLPLLHGAGRGRH